MNYTLHEWANLVFRWAHVFAGVMWIGQTYFFTWLDARLHDPDEKGEVWMVHSGGFYVVNKQTSPELTRPLHWFKWEAALTWLTGIVLLVIVYYLGGILIDGESPVSLPIAIAISVGSLVAGWIIYDLLWISPLAKNEVVAAAISYLLLVGSAWAFFQIFSSRAAYMQTGALMGTIMAFNVWVRILPGQRKMIAAVREGGQADPLLADRAKKRSKHNTFTVVPLVLIMLSNHFPTTTYGNQYNLAVLAVLILVGWVVAKVIRTR